METLEAIERRVDAVLARLPAASNSSAAIHVTDRGVTVGVGLLAVCCLIGAAALAYVSSAQSEMAREMVQERAALMQAQSQELRDRIEMLEAQQILAQSRAKREAAK